MIIIDETESQKNKRMKGKKGVMQSFLQLICKASLIFESNLELVLSITLKERELHKSKHVVVVKMSKNNKTWYPFWYVP